MITSTDSLNRITGVISLLHGLLPDDFSDRRIRI